MPCTTSSRSVSHPLDPFTLLTISSRPRLPLAFESAALAEKLLNDLLKTTEGFQRLKKMNEELKSKTNGESQYVSNTLVPCSPSPTTDFNYHLG